LYRHHLTSDLESAIRGSNAQYDSPDILRRLDARILDFQHGELGWDCFALEYKVDAPLNAVLDKRAMYEYDQLFHHLLKIKRTEVILTSGWMRAVSGAKLFERIPGALLNETSHAHVRGNGGTDVQISTMIGTLSALRTPKWSISSGNCKPFIS
jgi:gamma-tubulin complex component 3